MTDSLFALLLYFSWTLLLVAAYIGYRSYAVLTGQARSDGFPAAQPHGPQWYQRLMRAHMNALENLPIFAGLILVAEILQQSAITDALALTYVGLRVAQSIVHLLSVNALWVNLRFALFLLQKAIVLYWLVQLLALAGAA